MKNITRTLAVLLSTLALLLVGVAPAHAKEVKHFRWATELQVETSAHPKAQQVKRPNATPGSNAYGWNWDHPVKVCDMTGNPVWDVAGAIERWSIQGLELYASCDNPDIIAEQGDANAFCNSTNTIIGCAGADIDPATNEPIRGRIVMNQDWADWVYTETQRGGTLHEMGHVVGFGHAPSPMTNADAVMGIPIPTSGARTTLSNYDRGGVRLVY